MATVKNGFRCFVLGLLSQRPMSGYDIKRLFGRFDWLLGNSSFGSIYSALHALLEDGLVSVQTVRHPNKPDRKVYTINNGGQHTLQHWLRQSATDASSPKSFIMRLFLATSHTNGGLSEYMRHRHRHVATHRTALEDMLRDPVDAGQQLVCEYGLALADAELEWLDSTLSQLQREPVPEEDLENDQS